MEKLEEVKEEGGGGGGRYYGILVLHDCRREILSLSSLSVQEGGMLPRGELS